ncbi:MAG: 5-guanidino-2-oxopentanoate decarboxylase [Pseudomonadales bacterium]|jgi:acetolactate synthase-1/2/3 large subunit|nr:5-guanidino-2-oxopentanoate decarboxylase [Pseudomonadales bacterium]MDP7593976.1 5-guanidino-2-oxopentanoate decarboxylase [Pseudomonadales bacterium]HJN48868.1 5-guanidino-2-oxopentanoate decarboxylase [Pseudomonadales bacterium]|tara:strand:- start:359 stop:1942 length:1584 start_codon:yes stop_codon:yes gene_type:complete
MANCGEALVSLLEAYHVDTVFGIPGVHTVELYRGLARSDIRHISARHEQGAGFMADGYARVSGRPGVCFIITGPGITNIATAMAQAYSDSIPMLVISSVNKSGELGLGAGQLHELPYQRNLTAQFTEFSHTLLDGAELPEVLARAFAVFSSRRPAPVHVEIPIDVIESEIDISTDTWPTATRPGPDSASIGEAAQLLRTADKPLLILGGGAVDAGEAALKLVNRLEAPVINTVAAKGVIAASHPLCLDDTLAFKPVRELINDADVVLAVATEFSETDRYGDERPLRMKGKLIRIDIDPEQLVRNHKPWLSILSDAGTALAAISARLDAGSGSSGTARVKQVKKDLQQYQNHRLFLQKLRQILPDDCIIAGDSTQPVYAANSFFPVEQPRCWITSVTGYGTLGYALPAAIGAKLALPERPVICIVGDGGFLFTISELAVAVELGLTIPIVLWNNQGYGEIRNYMLERQIPLVGVDLYTPDFIALAEGFGCVGRKASSMDHFQQLMNDALAHPGPSIIEILEDSEFLNE